MNATLHTIEDVARVSTLRVELAALGILPDRAAELIDGVRERFSHPVAVKRPWLAWTYLIERTGKGVEPVALQRALRRAGWFPEVRHAR